MSSPPEQASLAERIRRGDRAAFDALVHAHWRAVLAFFWRRLPRHLAEDLAQTVFVNAWSAVARGHGERLDDDASWARYLLACAHNLLRDHWRRRRHEPTSAIDALFAGGEPVSATPDAATANAEVELRAALDDCLDRLDDTGRDLCWLHFVGGQSKRELARAAARPESSIRADIARALQRLRRCLEAKGASI